MRKSRSVVHGDAQQAIGFDEKLGAGEANRTPDPNLGNVVALLRKWLKSKLFSVFGDET
jgi:hypothetical protein